MKFNPEVLLLVFGLVLFSVNAYCSFYISRVKKKYLLLVMLRPEDFMKDLRLFYWSMILGMVFVGMELAASILIGLVLPFWFMVLYVPIAITCMILITMVFVRWYKRLRW